MMKRTARTCAARVTSLLLAAALCILTVGSALADTYDIGSGSISVAANDAGQTVSQPDAGIVDYADPSPVVTGTTTENTVTVTSTDTSTASVTLDNVHIDAPDTSAGVTVSGNADITVEGDNTVQGGANHAGVEVGVGDSVTIHGNDNGTQDTLVASAGETTGTTGTGAGVGGANGEAGGHIAITGDVTVTATGGGVSVNADSGKPSASASAGIGGGSDGAGGQVEIGGNADVTAIGGGTNANTQSGSFSAGGAGIGAGGAGKDGGTVIIKDNASVTAQGGYNAAGIGGASNAEVQSAGATTEIDTTGTVTANGGSYAAGIGGGARGNGGEVTVKNGTVTANGGTGGAGIGGGGGGYYGGTTKVKPRNISGGNGGIFRLVGGTVQAQGGAGAAGIGGGSGADHAFTQVGSIRTTKLAGGGSGANITVLGGKLVAVGGMGAVGVGSGSDVIRSTANVMDKSGVALFSEAATADAGSLAIGGGSGSITAGAPDFAAISAKLTRLLWTVDENGYLVVDREADLTEAGLYEWSPKETPDPADPVPPVPPTDPTVPDGPADPADPAEPATVPAGTQDSGDATVIPAGVGTGAGAVIPTEATPLAGPATQWALVNLLCAIAVGLLSACMLAGLLGKRTRDGETVRKHTALRLCSLVVFAAGVLAFLLTENMGNPMGLTDGYTPLMAGILCGQALLTALSTARTVETAQAEEA